MHIQKFQSLDLFEGKLGPATAPPNLPQGMKSWHDIINHIDTWGTG